MHAESTQVTIYSAPRCPFAQRTRLVLTEKQVPFDVVEIDLQDTPDWFHRLSPYGKVPVLTYGDDTVWESAIINEYVEEVWPEPAMMPEAPGARAYARFWIDFCNTQFVPLFYKLLLAQDEDARHRHRDALAERLRFIADNALDDPRAGRFFLGDVPSLVDFTFYPFFERFCVLAHYRQFEVPPQALAVESWWARMRELQTVQALMRDAAFYVPGYAHYADGSASGSTAQEMRDA